MKKENFVRRLLGKNGKSYLFLLLVFTGGIGCFAQKNISYRDATGRYAGSAANNGRTTAYRDASGRYAGSATVNGKTTTYRDATGRYKGSSRK